MTSEMDRNVGAIARTQALILEQQFDCSRHRRSVCAWDSNATRTDRLREPAEVGTDDHTAASNSFKRNKAKSLCTARGHRHNPMSCDKSSQVGAALNPRENDLRSKTKCFYSF